MKLLRKVGATSEIWQVFIADSSSTTGAGLTALVFNTASLTAYYHRDTDTTATAISLVTMTVGTFTSSGFKEVDATNMPGVYQFCPPNAAIATGAKSCIFMLKGATNMAQLPIEVDLDGQVDVTHWNGTAVSAPATAGIPDVNIKNIDNDAASASGTVTFPNATLASTTNITGGTITTVTTTTTATNLTNLPAITAGWLTDTGIAADAITAAKIADNAIDTATFAAGTTIPRVTLADTLTTYTGNTVQTGDSFARIGANGVGLTSVALADATSDAVLADAIWNAATATYGSAGSYGLLIETDLDATISSRLASASYTAPDNTSITAIKTKTDFLPSATAGSAGGVLIAGNNAATTLATLAVTGALTVGGGVAITNSTTNGHGLSITGNGTGHGVLLTSGSGSTGNALTLTAASTIGNGLYAEATGIASGIYCYTPSGSGIYASGVTGISAIGSLNGITGQGGTGAGLNLNGPSGLTAMSVQITGTTTLTGAVTASAGITANITGNLIGTVSTLTTYTGNTPQTGDSFARLGVAGVGLTNLGDTRIANLDAAVTTRMATYTQPTGFLAATFPSGTITDNTTTPSWYSASSAPTVGQIATAVWQDATAGDFTVASSIGKSLFTGGNAPGAANGLLIAGTNASLDITGALTVAGGVAITNSTSNGSGLTATGNGLGSGFLLTSGSGASGNALTLVAASTNGNAFSATGSGTGDGMKSQGGGGVSSAGLRLNSTATLTGYGLVATGAGTSLGHGLIATGAGTNGDGVYLNATGSGGSLTANVFVTASNASNNITGVAVASIAANAITEASFSTVSIAAENTTAGPPAGPIAMIYRTARWLGIIGSKVVRNRSAGTVSARNTADNANLTQVTDTTSGTTDTITRTI